MRLDGERQGLVLELQRLDRRIRDLRRRAVDVSVLKTSLTNLSDHHNPLDRAGLKELIRTLVKGVTVEVGEHPEGEETPALAGVSESQM